MPSPNIPFFLLQPIWNEKDFAVVGVRGQMIRGASPTTIR